MPANIMGSLISYSGNDYTGRGSESLKISVNFDVHYENVICQSWNMTESESSVRVIIYRTAKPPGWVCEWRRPKWRYWAPGSSSSVGLVRGPVLFKLPSLCDEEIFAARTRLRRKSGQEKLAGTILMGGAVKFRSVVSA